MKLDTYTGVQLANAILGYTDRATREEKELVRETAKDRFAYSPGMPSVPRVGVELERFVVDEEGTPTDASAIIHEGGYSCEPGPWQIEDALPPLDVERLSDLEAAIDESQRRMRDTAQRHDQYVIPLGSVPNLPNGYVGETSTTQRYLAMRNYKELVQGQQDPSPFKNLLKGEASCQIQGVHLNLQVTPKDAIDMLNHSFEVETYRLAIGGNAAFIYGQDTGYNDLRHQAWAENSDFRTAMDKVMGDEIRVGFPGRHFRDLDDYLEYCVEGPLFHLRKDNGAVGSDWTVGKLKMLKDATVLEMRGPSPQPSAREEVSMFVMAMGSLWYRKKEGKPPMMDMGVVNWNASSAQLCGLKGKMINRRGETVDTVEAVRRDLVDRAIPGAQALGYSQEEIDYYTAPLLDRLRTRETPSDGFRRDVQKIGMTEAILSRAH